MEPALSRELATACQSACLPTSHSKHPAVAHLAAPAQLGDHLEHPHSDVQRGPADLPIWVPPLTRQLWSNGCTCTAAEHVLCLHVPCKAGFCHLCQSSGCSLISMLMHWL